MLRSEEDRFLGIACNCVIIAGLRGVIGIQESKECRTFLENLVKERDALRETIVRQEGALTNQARGDNAAVQDLLHPH